jgi:hypothetical protein
MSIKIDFKIIILHTKIKTNKIVKTIIKYD